MGSHVLEKGKWMASYRYMYMRMEENYDGSSTVSDASVLNDFIVTPTDMEMQMHMFSLMYAPTDRLTLMGMINLVQTSMNHRIGRDPLQGQTFRTEAEGIGDSSFGALYQLYRKTNHQLHVGLSVLLPTAETDNEDFLPPCRR